MTHFMIGAIVPKEEVKKGDAAVKGFIDANMDPYSENLETAPRLYMTKAAAKKDMGAWLKDNKQKGKKWPELVQDYYGCEVDAKGNVMTTSNQDSFWDWYRVGGRWDGVIVENEQRSENGFNFDDKHESVANNSIKVGVLLKKLEAEIELIKAKNVARDEIHQNMVNEWGGEFGFWDIVKQSKWWKTEEKEITEFCTKLQDRTRQQMKDFQFYNKFLLGKILDKDGQVHEGVEYGWWGFSKPKDPEKDWAKEFADILRACDKDDLVVILDCHV
jgi:hypothetical protein